jgi:hypothetical protein
VPFDYFQNNVYEYLSVVDKRLMGRKFRGNFGSLPGFGNANLCFFPMLRKMGQSKAVINERVTCTSGPLGRCLRHSFGIPSSPLAFLIFNEFANLCMSQGRTFLSYVSSTDASRTWDSSLHLSLMGFVTRHYM